MRKSLKHKLFILLIVISIIPIALVYYSSRYFMFKSSTEYSSSVASQYVHFVTEDLNEYFQNINKSLDALVTHPDFQHFLSVPNNDYISQAKYSIGFREILQNLLQSKRELIGVLYVDRMDKLYFESIQYGRNAQYPLLTLPFVAEAKKANRPTITGVHEEPFVIGYRGSALSFVKPVIDLRTGATIAWLTAEIDSRYLLERIQNSRGDWDSRMVLYNPADGNVVSADPIAPDLLTVLKASIQDELEAERNVIFAASRIRYEASYREIGFGEWKLIWFAELSSLSEGMRNASSLTALIAAVSLLISLVVAFPVMGKLLRPLYDLMRGMKGVGRGAYIPVAIATGRDEIGSLTQIYNRMLNDLQKLEQEVYQAKLQEKEKELLQLQAQINPHFLFNTLETIESYSLKNAGDAVGDMVQSVAKMMRYNVRNDGGWAPLQEEIAYIRHFMNIHRYRNGAELAIRMNIDESLLDVPVMKLSIQPFIENSIKYGWSPNMDAREFSLSLRIAREDGRLLIDIRDTGVGMLPEFTDRIQRMIESRGESDDPFFASHTGIRNVCRRYMLAYDGQARIRFASTPADGTQITIEVPLSLRSGRT